MDLQKIFCFTPIFLPLCRKEGAMLFLYLNLSKILNFCNPIYKIQCLWYNDMYIVLFGFLNVFSLERHGIFMDAGSMKVIIMIFVVIILIVAAILAVAKIDGGDETGSNNKTNNPPKERFQPGTKNQPQKKQRFSPGSKK